MHLSFKLFYFLRELMKVEYVDMMDGLCVGEVCAMVEQVDR